MSNKTLLSLKYWGPVVGWMGLIFFLSSRTRVTVSDSYAIQFLVFKSLHVIEYGVLAVLLYRAFSSTSKRERWQNLYLAWLYTVAYGMTDEIHQVFVPTREGRVRDIFIDTIGATIATFYLWKILPKVPKRLRFLAKKLDIH